MTQKEQCSSQENGFYETKSGIKRKVMTSKGWDFHACSEHGETSYIALKDIKETNPIEVVEYVKLHKLHNEPAFAWWVNTALKKGNAMISKVARRIKKKMKFGIEIPTNYEEAVFINRANGNRFWQDAVKKKMSNVEIALKLLDDGTKVPIGFKEITCHLIFDVKFDLTRKAK